MNRRRLYRVATLVVCLLLTGSFMASAVAAAPRNIVVIFADDIGYGDLGCYGATLVKTPNLDRLAREGMRFTDAHAAASVCTPTRYSLITGQYAWRYPPGASILSGAAPLSIRPQMLTVPKVLKQAGYVTGVVGKWHLGLGTERPDYNQPIVPGPREVGFDYSFIIPATGDRVPCVYVEDGRVAGYDPSDPIAVSYKEPIGDEPTGADHPELLKVKPSQGHNNTIINGISRIGYMTGGKAARWVDEDMADTITRKAVEFIEKNKDKRFFLHFNTHDIHVPRVPNPRFAGTSRCGTRGDVIQELDWSAGQVLAALDRLGLANDTLVFFSSDNGGVMDDGYQDGSGNDTSGHKCNGVLRGYKGGPYEGGHRVPLLARWPGNVPAGASSAELVCTVDLLATVAELAGQRLPDSGDAGPDSFSFVPALLSERPATPCRDHLVTQSGNYRELAIRKGSWKLIPAAAKTAKKADRGVELYRLDTDLAETTNLAAEHPEKVRELAALLDQVRAAGRSRPSGTREQPGGTR
jgi:arylsulfatase A-like enzyme